MPLWQALVVDPQGTDDRSRDLTHVAGVGCRHAACVDMVQQKNGPDAAAVLKAMLHATQAFETQPKASIYSRIFRPCCTMDHALATFA